MAKSKKKRKESNLPRGPAPSHEVSVYGRWAPEIFDGPIENDSQAEDLVSVVAYFEDWERRLEEFFEQKKAMIEQAKDKLATTPAYQSLAEYVRRNPNKGGKTLELPSGKITLRLGREKVEILDPQALKNFLKERPQLAQEILTKRIVIDISKTALKLEIQRAGPIKDEEGKVLAELREPEEIMTVTPSGQELQPPKILSLLDGAFIAKEEEDEDEDR